MSKQTAFKVFRKKQGTQAKVASDNKISEIYLRKVENEAVTPGRDLMFQFANYFETDVLTLFPNYFRKKAVRRVVNR